MVVFLAYKRYVHKSGKRHGPYYYKNVRDESGKVKSIYLGKVSTKGKKPLEVAIVFLIALLIIISALFFIQNRNIVLSRLAVEESMIPFEVDQILIKVLVKADEFIEKELRIMNVESKEQTIQIDALGISDIIDVLDGEFTIKPGQTKIVKLNFSSFDKVKSTEQNPGVYIGKILAKTDSYEKSVPVVVEIESRNVLFDMNLNPVARDRKVLQGSSTTFEIRVFNLQSIESFNIDMDFFVKDIDGNTIISERESVVVKTQASFFKTLKIPENLKTGNYVFVAQASLGNSIGTASYLFNVEEVEEEEKAQKFIGFCRNDPLCWSLSIIVLLLIFTIGAYAYFFIGVLIYRKIFGGRIPEKIEEIKIEEPIIKEREVESYITRFFRNWEKRRVRARQRRFERKLEFEKQKEGLRLQKEKERLEKERIKRKLIEEKRKTRKEEIFDFFHRLGLVKTEDEKREIESKRQRQKELRELEKKRDIEEKQRKLRLKEQEAEKKRQEKEKGQRERKRRIFNFFHGLGLVKTKEDEEEKRREKRRRELKRRRREEQKKIELEEKQRKIRRKELEAEKGREEERKKAERGRRKKVFDFFHRIGLAKTEKEKREIEKNKKEERKRKELERRRREEERKKAERERRKKVFDFFHRLGLAKTELERKRREEERKLSAVERRGLVGKSKRLIDKGYRLLDRNNLKGANKAYTKLMDVYTLLPSERKVEIFKEINSFYKSLLLKKQQLRLREENEKKRALEKKKLKELEGKRREKERERKRKLMEEKRKERRKTVFNFFHRLGLAKTEKEKREIENRKRKEIKRKELEIKKEQERRKKEEKERSKRKLEEKRRQELERKTAEGEKRREKEREEAERKTAEEESRKKELEEERQRELEKKREEAERKKAEEERKKKESDNKRLRELEIKRIESERRRKEQEKNRKLKAIKGLEESINEKDNKINKLKERINEVVFVKNRTVKDTTSAEKKIEDIKKEKAILLRVYNENLKSKKQIARNYENKRLEWEKRYDNKLDVKSKIKGEIKQEHDDEIRVLENELRGLSAAERREQEKWKKLELKAKYKLEEKDRQRTINDDLKRLQEEKRGMEKDFNEKKQKLGKIVFGKELIQKRKEFDDEIKQNENGVKELGKEIEAKDISLKRFENRIKRLEEEKENETEKLREKKRGLGGLGYIVSFFEEFRGKRGKETIKAVEGRKEGKRKQKKWFQDIFKKKEPEKREPIKEEKQATTEEGYDLEKSLRDLEEKPKQKKPSIMEKFPIIGKKITPETKEKKEIRKKREGKSSLFIKCHKLLLKADNAMQNNDIQKAKRLYLKSRNMYIKLEYLEKKELYSELNAFYSKISKAGK